MKAAAWVLALVLPPAPQDRSVAPAGRPGLKISIEAPEKALHVGRKMPLRFTIENEGAEPAKVDEPADYLEGLEIRDFEDKVVKPRGKTPGPARRARTVEPGGFFGRTVDISSALSVPEDREGWYRIRWSLGGTTSNELRVYVVREWIATIETNYGNILIEFRPDQAPTHVANFLKLSRSGSYEGSLFHRIIRGFMMQGGAPRDPKNAMKAPLLAEFSSEKHVFGTVSAARADDPNSATSEFFICFGAQPFLDGKYTVFGQLVEGADVVKEIERVKTDHSPCKGCGQSPQRPGSTPCCGVHHQDRPLTDVVIKKVSLSVRKKE